MKDQRQWVGGVECCGGGVQSPAAGGRQDFMCDGWWWMFLAASIHGGRDGHIYVSRCWGRVAGMWWMPWARGRFAGIDKGPRPCRRISRDHGR